MDKEQTLCAGGKSPWCYPLQATLLELGKPPLKLGKELTGALPLSPLLCHRRDPTKLKWGNNTAGGSGPSPIKQGQVPFYRKGILGKGWYVRIHNKTASGTGRT